MFFAQRLDDVRCRGRRRRVSRQLREVGAGSRRGIPVGARRTRSVAPRARAPRAPSRPSPRRGRARPRPSTGPIRLNAASRTRSPSAGCARPAGRRCRWPFRDLSPDDDPHDSPRCSAASSSGRRRRRAGASPGERSSSPIAASRARSSRSCPGGAGEAQVGEPGLTRAEQLSLAADLEVALRDLEAVGRRDHRLQPLAARSR